MMADSGKVQIVISRDLLLRVAKRIRIEQGCGTFLPAFNAIHELASVAVDEARKGG